MNCSKLSRCIIFGFAGLPRNEIDIRDGQSNGNICTGSTQYIAILLLHFCECQKQLGSLSSHTLSKTVTLGSLPLRVNCNCNLNTPTRGAGEDIQYIHKIILGEGKRESELVS